MMNTKWARGQSARLPWIPVQLTSLCRNTGIPGCRLRPDELPIRPMAPKSEPSSSKGMPSTYLTRKGELFLYSSTQEVQPWQSQVTLEELNFLADKRVNLSRAVEGEESRKQFLSKPLEVVGILKKNIEFPSSWLSPARETVPPIAVKQGLTMSEFLQLNRVRRGTSFHGPVIGFHYQPLKEKSENDDESLLHLQPRWVSTQSQEHKKQDPKVDKRVSRNRNNPRSTLPRIYLGEARGTKKKNKRRSIKTNEGENKQSLAVPKIEVNSSNSGTRDSSRLLFSRSSLASETLSILDGQWSEVTTEREHEIQCNSLNSGGNAEADEEDAEWSYESTRSASVIESMMTEPSNFRQRRSASYSLDSTLIDSTLHMNKHNQINVNAVCPDSTTTVVDRSNSLNQPTTPSVATAATITTYASSRWSRNTPNPIYHLPYSPNRMTPASTPSRRINTQTSLLETAKMLLTESSKLEPICGPLASPREQTGKPINVESMIGGGDAGEKVDHEKVRATLERKRHREAAELQKQISALDATIERLYSRTREKTLYLHKVVNETFRHIQDTITQRSTERRAKQQQKRRVTSELFLRHFRDRQARKRRIRIKLGLRAAKSGRMTGVLPAILTSREVEEGDALRKWQMKEDARDNEEQSMALKFEEEAAAKATSRLRWLREVATTQLRHLEEFIRVTQPKNEERASKDVPVDTILFDLRAKHQRLINLLQKYGITTDEENEPTVTAYQLGRERTLMSSTDAPVPATVALRTLWSDLQEDKLTRLQRQAINHFERVIHRESRSPFTRPTASPRARRRKQWKQDATFLSYYGHAITRFGFSYFDFWKVKEIDSEDEEEKRKKTNQIPVHTTLSQIRREELARQRVAFNSSTPRRPIPRIHPRRPLRRDIHIL